MASNGNPGNRKDPLPAFCFKVTLTGGMEAFFKSVSGLKFETEAIPVREGGANDTTFMLVGATKWSPLVLKNGFTSSSALMQWRQEWMEAQGNPAAGGMTRISGTITQLDTELNPKAEWAFTRGWPTKWELSELDASKSELSIETLEITHEGLKFTKKG